MNSSNVSNCHVYSTSDFAGKLDLAFFSVFVSDFYLIYSGASHFLLPLFNALNYVIDCT